ncbi:hypothetical protein H310_02478 [Aphanomyces invadans]|uniref:Peptidase M28 domain-containing protein n=1 Tax=Aphanomyces invadans TaxID=157072 RepID=A0A024UR89_9STRA|nr:hypothetical protein H310_02478 [Aphanomyces invadans]ETW08138.1 hypothetical protein H310_02478 [Aphanomyces invadans]|eukprot:XP_008864231.1 hypothetical protein H310_02478 [Aphanomyces invadans]
MKVFTLLALAAVACAADDARGKRLIATSDSTAEWLTPSEISDLEARSIGFVDATNGDWDKLAAYKTLRHEILRLAPKKFPTGPGYKSVVGAAISKIKTADLKALLTDFVTKFSTRYKDSAQGVQSCAWIFDQVKKLSPTRPDVKLTVRQFKHSWGQYSVIARLEPTVKAKANDIVIATAHQDSINRYNIQQAPGADDDGSGTITILQALKYLLATKQWVPVRPVEFHWYSAEETGLQGSADVVKTYASQRVDVYAQMQQDMTGWVAPGKPPVVSFMDDNTDPGLTAFLETLVKAYLSIPATHGNCGYGCSDHASWNRAGYPASMPFETNFRDLNPNIHSTRDTLATIDYNHIAEFTKLTMSYIIELTQGVR